MIWSDISSLGIILLAGVAVIGLLLTDREEPMNETPQPEFTELAEYNPYPHLLMQAVLNGAFTALFLAILWLVIR